jgi:hypothetical protein
VLFFKLDNNDIPLKFQRAVYYYSYKFLVGLKASRLVKTFLLWNRKNNYRVKKAFYYICSSKSIPHRHIFSPETGFLIILRFTPVTRKLILSLKYTGPTFVGISHFSHAHCTVQPILSSSITLTILCEGYGL